MKPGPTRLQPRRPPVAAAALLAGMLAASLVGPGFAAVQQARAAVSPAAADAATRPDQPRRAAVRLARATWDTGWFQAEIVRELLVRLGYRVDGPATMENADFYAAVAAGEVDLWANGWFPLHEQYLRDLSEPAAVVPVGTAVRGGALEGYLVDRATATRHGIDSLDDLRDPQLARLFDRDGDGRADLIGCNPDWACAASIDRHLDALGLRATVEQVQGDYSPLMAEAVERFGAGDPLLFYTWTPNWTVGELVPGRHVVWLEIPPLPEGADGVAPRIADVPGSDQPLRLGWPPNDIRIVAGRSFLAGNPAIATLLERIRIPIDDIHRQNGRMIGGEDDPADFRRHAHEWIDRHRDEVDRWLHAARAQQDDVQPATAATLPHVRPEVRLRKDVIRVATQRVEPFVTYHDRRYSGFSIELWERIAGELGLEYELYGVNSLAKLLDDVERGAADAATAGIGITSEREVDLDFSHAFFESGLQILVRDPDPSLLHSLLAQVRSVVVSRQLLYVTGLFLFMLLVSAHAVWLFERAHNPQFPRRYVRGVGEAFWWAAVTVTTVGYGDKTPRRSPGKIFALLWMFAGYFVFAYFTASVASSFTVSELQGTIAGPDDLFGKRVATVARTPAAEYLDRMGIQAEAVPAVDVAIDRLEAGAVEAVVYDAPVLQHHAAHAGRGSVHVVGPVFWQQQYGIALAGDSPLRDPINQALLRLMEEGEYQRIQRRWFGRGTGGEVE